MADVPPEPAVKEEARRDRSRDRGSEDRRRDRDRRDEREERGRRDGDRRDRDRDYKRRKSGTPPAGGSYRDRRHSPRRSSPPYKRRRDEDFDGRRGSPGDDRRYSPSHSDLSFCFLEVGCPCVPLLFYFTHAKRIFSFGQLRILTSTVERHLVLHCCFTYYEELISLVLDTSLSEGSSSFWNFELDM